MDFELYYFYCRFSGLPVEDISTSDGGRLVVHLKQAYMDSRPSAVSLKVWLRETRHHVILSDAKRRA